MSRRRWKWLRFIRWPATARCSTGRSARSASPSQCIGPGTGGWRQPATTGRDHPGASGCAVSRRATGVRPQGAGGAARATGIGPYRHRPGAGQGAFSGALPAGGGNEPCPCGYLERPNGRCRCRRSRSSATATSSRTAARPHRPASDRGARGHRPQRSATDRPDSAVLAAQVAEARRLQLARQGCANTFSRPGRPA